MTEMNVSTPVGTLVINDPSCARVFDELQIDYCCGGDVSLDVACRQRQLDPETVLQQIRQSTSRSTDTRDWASSPLTELCDHIEATHHAFLRKELPRLDQLVTKVADAHGDRHPELNEIKRVFQALKAELIPHMMKEEQILFPVIRQLESTSQPVTLPFGTIENPIRNMEHEHEVAGTALRNLRRLTSDYTIPKDACNSYIAMLQGLNDLELDLHQHIHKENNILFPKAAEREAALNG